MTVDRPPPLTEGVPKNPPRVEAGEALKTLESFNRDQVLWLMATAMRWGYELRVDEENGAYPPTPVFLLGKWFDQAEHRARADAEARLPRLGDHTGGPVEVWGGEGLEAAA